MSRRMPVFPMSILPMSVFPMSVLPLMVLLLAGCGPAPELSDNTQSSDQAATTQAQTVAPPATASQTVSTNSNDYSDQGAITGNQDNQREVGSQSNAIPSETVANGAVANGAVPKDRKANQGDKSSVAISGVRTDAVPSDTVMVPGERLGPVTLTSTYADLMETFGRDRLSDTEVHLGEGFMTSATHVDLGDDYSFSVVWTDGDRTAPLEIRDLGPGWQTPEGIHYGMSFDQLQETLGSFELLGFGWDYGGTVMLETTTLAHYSGKMIIRVEPSTSDWETKSEQLLRVSGDQPFSSTNPNFSGLDMEVYELILRLNAL
ncbi:MAG: hypothetical protein F6K30_02805 [Cyanothece sp. SIO2G6]|nr:hypothetical protein [Cyanothece sp. SIO2G6]